METNEHSLSRDALTTHVASFSGVERISIDIRISLIERLSEVAVSDRAELFP